MRLATQPPILSYLIPPTAPQPVADAYREFERVAHLVADTQGDLYDARANLTVAKAKDIRAIADATANGVETKDAQKHERAALAEIERLSTTLKGQQKAADEAGDRLADAIEANADEWEACLIEARNEAAAQYDRAIVEAREALAHLVPAQAGVDWVRRFDATQAKTGRYNGFAGGRLRVSAKGAGVPELRAGVEYNPASLLRVAALATKQPPRSSSPLSSKAVVHG